MSSSIIELSLPKRIYAPSVEKTENILNLLVNENPGKYLTYIEDLSPTHYLNDEILYQDAFGYAKKRNLTNSESLFQIVFEQTYNHIFVNLQKKARFCFEKDCWYYETGRCSGCKYASKCICNIRASI